MRTIRAAAGALAAAVMSASGAAPLRADAPPSRLVLDHVTVVDVRSGRLSRDRAVVIADGRIVRIAPAGAAIPRGARRVDGGGGYLVPGFDDMHAHNLNTDSPETSLPLMLANGITGFRQMAGSPQLLAARAAGTLPLPADAPALLAMPGTILAGPAVADPAGAAAEVDRQKAQGTDFIKVIDLPPPAFRAAAAEATKQGLRFAGHLPPTFDPHEAMRLGMLSIEHMGPGIALLLSCSRDEAAIRAAMAAAPAGRTSGTDFTADAATVRRMLANPVLSTPAPAYAGIAHVLASYDPAKCRAFAAEIAASGTWIVPTLSRLEAMELGDAPFLRDNPDLRYVPASSRALWQSTGDAFARLTPQQQQILAGLFAAQLRLTALLDRAGVKMMAGTDFGGGWLVPGFSLHHEFDLLARAGVPPLHILQMATIDPAVFLHREATMGSVAPGRNADLVLLAADPTADAANLHRIAGVVRAGRWYDRAALDAIEQHAAAQLADPAYHSAAADYGVADHE